MRFPKEEKYELALQLQRAALSIPLNIAEGCGRYTENKLINETRAMLKAFIKFLRR